MESRQRTKARSCAGSRGGSPNRAAPGSGVELSELSAYRPRVGVAGLLEDGKGLLACVEGLFVVAEHRSVPADRVEREPLPLPVVGGPKEGEGLLRVIKRCGWVALSARYVGEAVVGARASGLLIRSVV